MGNKFHGVFSLVLVFFSILIGFFSIGYHSLLMGILYLLITIISSVSVLYFYCAKCYCRFNSCVHIFPGKLTRHLPFRDQGEYTRQDYLGTIIPISIIFLFPQFWLLKNLTLFVFFWISLLAGVVQINTFLCRTCENKRCMLCKKENPSAV